MHDFQRLLLRLLFISMACWLISSCGTALQTEAIIVPKPKPLPIQFYGDFGEQPELISDTEIFTLSPEQEKAFFKYLKHPSNKNLSRHKVVSNYLQHVITGFNYHSDTYIASDALSKKQGNCLSLAILTTALSRLADVDVEYELMQTAPVYQKKGNTILTSQHVRSLLYKPDIPKKPGFIYIFRPVIKIDYFPTRGALVKRRVSESEFISMFYRNKAAEAIIEKRMKEAFWLSMKSFEYAQLNSHAINMLALVYQRLGYAIDAEKLYQYGIQHTDKKLELLSNYYHYLLKNKRLVEAKNIKSKIVEINEPNPFDWLYIADDAVRLGDLNRALKYYDKVVRLAPYLHHGYYGKGKVYFLKGNHQRAKKAYDKAAELAYEKETRAMYKAKLSALSSYTKN